MYLLILTFALGTPVQTIETRDYEHCQATATRYLHKHADIRTAKCIKVDRPLCNTDTPTKIYAPTITHAQLSYAFRQHYPGIRGRFTLRDGIWHAKGMYKGELKRCTFN